jgi:hypothetical protein
MTIGAVLVKRVSFVSKLKRVILLKTGKSPTCLTTTKYRGGFVELKAGLRYGDYCSKLVHFKGQKISMFKKALA